jgi:amino acid adenylation domain-containing protein
LSGAVLEGFRLSAQQRRLWSLGAQGTELWARAWCAVGIEGPLEPDRLRRAASALAARHDILRTTFPRKAGMRNPFQVVAETGAPSWQVVELSAASRPLTAIEELVRQEAAVPMDLERGPLFRVRLGALSSSTYILLITLPTFCADRKSLYAIARSLADLYGGGQGENADNEAPIQYPDFCQWQAELFESDDDAAAAARSYWERRSSAYRGVVAPFARVEDGPGVPARADFLLTPPQLEGIEAFCRAGDVSLADFLRAGWQTLIARTTGETEVVVADVHEGRKLDELAEALGLFAVSLPVSARLDENSAFADLVKIGSESRRQNDEWQEYFAGEIESDPAKAGQRLGFEFAQRPNRRESGGVGFSVLHDHSWTDAFAARVSCVRDAGGVRVLCETDPARLPASAARRIAGHLEPLLAAAAEKPEALVRDLPILGTEERRRILVDMNRTDSTTGRASCVHELFEEQVERTPEAPALVYEKERLTYAELNSRANALAVFLAEAGVGPDVPAGLCVDRSADMIIALLAILKAGGAYVPVNPEHPGMRLTAQLARSDCRIVVTQSRWLEKLAAFAGRKICLDRDRPDFERPATSNLARRAGPDNLAYLMHTSGSTGVPKGVAVRHASLVNYADFVVRDLLGVDPDSGPALSFATVSTIAADLGNTAIFPALISGGCLHVIGYETAMEGRRFAESLAENPIDVLKIVPSHLAALLSSGGGRGILPGRTLILGGEALSWDLVDRVRALGGSCEIVNHYGPTETTVGSLTFRIGPTLERLASTVPIGRPIANTRVFILDEARQPVPIGVPGELFIGGIGVARGYHNQPEATVERFISDPFSGPSGAQLYRTGDRARYLAEGDVEFLGRLDDQVKIRGFRIEPGEVRALLASDPGVREAAVLAREDTPGERRLVAYVVPTAGRTVSVAELRERVKGQLPDYMVPSAFVLMKTLPLTSNGKLDRSALPAPEHAQPERAYVEPRTPSEGVVAQIWAEVLKLERVGAEDNFFDLGGHSLLLTQVVSRMRKAFRRELPIRWLFESPTVTRLAARMDAAERDDLVRILDELEEEPQQEVERLEIGNEPPIRA